MRAFYSSASPELLRAGSRSLCPDSVLPSVPRCQGSAASPGCHPHLCCSWLLGALAGPCREDSCTPSASLSDVHSLAGWAQLSPSCPEATLLAICLTSATKKPPKLPIYITESGPSKHPPSFIVPADLEMQRVELAAQLLSWEELNTSFHFK